MTDVNRHEHIDQIVSNPFCPPRLYLLKLAIVWQKRQKGGIGSAAYDHNQKGIRAYFGGGAVETPVVHGKSNVGEYPRQQEAT